MAKKKREAFTFAVPEYMAPYLVNGDVGDMEDKEIKAADEFSEDVAKEFGNANFIPANDSETYFAIPDVGVGIGGFFASCIDLVIIES